MKYNLIVGVILSSFVATVHATGSNHGSGCSHGCGQGNGGLSLNIDNNLKAYGGNAQASVGNVTGGSATSNVSNTSSNVNNVSGGNSTAYGGQGGSSWVNANPEATSISESNSSQQQQQSQSQTNGNSNNSQNVTVNNNEAGGVNYSGSYTVKSAPSVGGSMLAPTAICHGTSSVGLSLIGFGFNVGTSWKDSECKMMNSAVTLYNMGLKNDAISVMCQIEHVKVAPICNQELKVEQVIQPAAVTFVVPTPVEVIPTPITKTAPETILPIVSEKPAVSEKSNCSNQQKSSKPKKTTKKKSVSKNTCVAT